MIQITKKDSVLFSSTVATYVIGDVVTTYVGLHANGIHEANTAVSSLLPSINIEYMLLMKAVVFALMLIMWMLADDRYSHYIPLSVTAIGVVVTVMNIWTIMSV